MRTGTTKHVLGMIEVEYLEMVFLLTIVGKLRCEVDAFLSYKHLCLRNEKRD
jgi:hypothetical protein